MKLALFNDYVPGVIRGDQIVDVSSALDPAIMQSPVIYRMNALIAEFDRIRNQIEKISSQKEGRPLSSVKLRAPVPRPSKMLFAISNYKENLTTKPLPLDMFFKAPSSVLDPGGTVVLPPHDAQLFFHEAELGFVIGKQGRNIQPNEAMNYVFGYTCLIDVSSANLGVLGRPTSKSFDTFCPMGPCIVTKDEIPNPHALGIKLWTDNVLRQDYNTDDMEHQIPEVIAWASAVLTLEAGDVFACGTNHQGLGPVQDGETVTMEIEQIGRLSINVADPLKRKWPKEIDRGIGNAVKQLRTTGVLPDSFFELKRIA